MRKAPVFGGGLLVSRHRKDSYSSVSRSPGFVEMKYSATRLELQRFRQVVTPISKSLRTHSGAEPEPPAAKSIVYRVPSPAPMRSSTAVLTCVRRCVRRVYRVGSVRALKQRLGASMLLVVGGRPKTAGLTLLRLMLVDRSTLCRRHDMRVCCV